jgi:hypothetical protein
MVNKVKSELEHWAVVARDRSPDDLTETTVPRHVLFGEAVDVAKFFQRYWETEVDDKGRVTRPGLESAVPKGAKRGAGRLGARTGEEILSLQRAAQEAQTRYLLTVETGKSPRARGDFLLGEIRATLEWYFDDHIEDEKDEMLARLDAAHEDDPASNDALASALDEYTHLGELHREALDGLGGFEAAYLDEAREVAADLRARPTQGEALSEKAREALTLRNQLVSLLVERMSLVRAAARFVFRRQPEIVREATSAYERRRRAATRRAKEPPAPAKAPEPPAGG